MGDRSDHVVGLTRTSERTADENVYAPVWQPDRVCLPLFRPYRD
jgi:hypothetical protein